jgi:hypothetical protein
MQTFTKFFYVMGLVLSAKILRSEKFPEPTFLSERSEKLSILCFGLASLLEV